MNSFIFYAEVPLIFAFGKDNENREQNKMNEFIFYASHSFSMHFLRRLFPLVKGKAQFFLAFHSFSSTFVP